MKDCQEDNLVTREVKEENLENNSNKQEKLGTDEEDKYKMCPQCGKNSGN